MTRVDIDTEISECVREMGGIVLDDALPHARPFENADYWFPDARVVIELKRLDHHYFESVHFEAEFARRYQLWAQQGRVKRVPNGTTLRLGDLPLDCALEVMDPLKNKLQGVVKKANTQIRATKEHLEVLDAKGVLFLVNDGNHSVPPLVACHVLGRCLSPTRFRQIDAVIHASINEPISSTDLPFESGFWISWQVPHRTIVDDAFITSIRSALMARRSRISGKVMEFSGSHELLAKAKFSGPSK